MSTAPKRGSTAWPAHEALPALVLQGVSAATSHVEASFAFDRPPGPAELEAVSGAMQVFADAAVHGAFPAPGTSGASGMAVLRPATLASVTCARQQLQLSSVDARAFQLLRNMVAGLRAQKVLVRSIRIGAPEHRGGPSLQCDWPDEDNEDAAYPAASNRATALLQYEDGDFAKARRFLAEVDNRLFPDQVTRFATWVQPWYALLEAGAFAMPVGHPAMTDSVAGFVSQFDPVTIEVAVDRFMASETAWGILANMVMAFDWQPRTLAGMTVD